MCRPCPYSTRPNNNNGHGRWILASVLCFPISSWQVCGWCWWTPRYTGVDVLSSLVPLQVTFSSRLASLFLKWKAHNWVLKGFALSWFSLYGVIMVLWRWCKCCFDVAEVFALGCYSQDISMNEAVSFEVDKLIICVFAEQHWRQYASLR